MTLNLCPRASIEMHIARINSLSRNVQQHLVGRGWARASNADRRTVGICFFERTPGFDYCHRHSQVIVPPIVSIDEAVYALNCCWDPGRHRLPGRRSPKLATQSGDPPELKIQLVRPTRADRAQVVHYNTDFDTAPIINNLEGV